MTTARWAISLLVATLAWGTQGASAQESGAELANPSGSEDNDPPPQRGSSPSDDDIPSEPIPPAPANVPPAYEFASPDATVVAEPSDSEIRIPARIAARIRVLDADLRNLSTRRGGAIIDGILSIVSGALSITLGALVPNDQQPLSNYMYVWGSATVARGVVDLSLSPRSEEASIEFSHMPMGSVEEVRARLRYGEEALESIAHRSRLSRIIEASLNIGAGLLVIPVYLSPSGWEVQNPYDYFVLIGSGISVIAGIVNLATRSEAEQRLDAYEELRDRLERERRRRADFGVSPMPGGGLATMRLEL